MGLPKEPLKSKEQVLSFLLRSSILEADSFGFSLSIGLGAPFLEVFSFFTISDAHLPTSYWEEMIIGALLFSLDLHSRGDATGKMSKEFLFDFSFLVEQILGDHGLIFILLTEYYLIPWQEIKFS